MSYGGRRRAASGPDARWWMVLALAGAFVAVVASIVIAINTLSTSSSSASGPPDGDGRTSESGQGGDCADPVQIAVPPSYVDTWTAIAGKYQEGIDEQPGGDAQCPAIEITPVEGPADLDDAAGWIPDDVSAIAGAGLSSGSGEPSYTAVASTPIVVATTSEVADSVGNISALLTPDVLGPLMRGRPGIASSGQLRIALPSMTSSTAGPVGFAALVQAATGAPLTGPPSYVEPTQADLTTIRSDTASSTSPTATTTHWPTSTLRTGPRPTSRSRPSAPPLRRPA